MLMIYLQIDQYTGIDGNPKHNFLYKTAFPIAKNYIFVFQKYLFFGNNILIDKTMILECKQQMSRDMRFPTMWYL